MQSKPELIKNKINFGICPPLFRLLLILPLKLIWNITTSVPIENLRDPEN